MGRDGKRISLRIRWRNPKLYPVDVGYQSQSQTFSYHRLPKQLLNLSIIKLDGSSFEVQVARTASISELKLAVEEVFIGSPSPREGDGIVCWSHVWCHFCLCYEGNKLVNDNMSIRTLGIKDGDQLYFVRHLSIDYKPITKRHNSKQRTTLKQLAQFAIGRKPCWKRH